MSLLQDAETDAGGALPVFVKRCDHCLLDLNVSKSFHWKGTVRWLLEEQSSDTTAGIIHGELVEIVSSYKYLGAVFGSQLKFESNRSGREFIYSGGSAPVVFPNLVRVFVLRWEPSHLFHSSAGLTVWTPSAPQIIGTQLSDSNSLWELESYWSSSCPLWGVHFIATRAALSAASQEDQPVLQEHLRLLPLNC